jgi:hypothetical protein
VIDDWGDSYDEVRPYKDFKVEEDCKRFELDLQESTYDKIFNPASYCRADGFHRLFYNRAGDLFYTSDISASEYRYSGDHYTGVCCQYICPRTGK